ncbi:hypothetical protein VMCG_06943 [Cytospora schulzeri]|uniref:HRDC domain-containing protein n=1 Tax=Cytospora schulzeri TaxID=448051 RepID=A0A423W266_9PEZI|nr:hypothetical protein VMCG_06943 [Valsa malicola]
MAHAQWPLSFQMSPTGHRFWSHKLYRGPQDQPVRIMYSRTKVESEEIAREFVDEKVVGFDMEWPWQADNKPNAVLQQRIGLIQIACEDKIALFHIGLHSGTTPNDLLAPSLRRIIESPDISKCGVAVLNADFSRLRKWFGLKPRGAFELSHLHNLVTHGTVDPSKCTTKLRQLAQQVEEHLGMPLHKGKVRTSNWGRPLSQDQIQYAAADAYSGFMLYHCMNAKRLSIHPSPPLPIYAEAYSPMDHRLKKFPPLQLQGVDDKGQVITALEFFQPRPEVAITDEADVSFPGDDAKLGGKTGGGFAVREATQGLDDRSLPPIFEEALELVRVDHRGRHTMFARAEDVALDAVAKLRAEPAAEQEHGNDRHSKPSAAPTKVRRADQRKGTISDSTLAKLGQTEMDARSRLLDEGRAEVLYQRLRDHRKAVARERKCAPFIIAHDTLLHAISRQCPRDDSELLRLRGVGKMKVSDFGQAWLTIVRNFVDEADPANSTKAEFEDLVGRAQQGDSLPTTSFLPASQPKTPGWPAPNVCRAESVVSVGLVQTPTMLHTGLLFSMGRTRLGDGMEEVGDPGDLKLNGDPGGFDGADGPYDETSAFGGQFKSPSPSSGFKRKRDEQTEAAAEKAANSARPGWPRRPPPPILNDANLQKTGEQSPQGTASPIMATTELSPLPQECDKASPAQSLLSTRSGPPQSPTHLAPQFQVSSMATPLRSVAPPAAAVKRLAGVGETPRPASQPTETGDAHIFRKKLVAFNKLVTATIQLSPVTIDYIVTRPPDTMENLLRIPGILPFANACSRANRDLLAFIVKSTPSQGSP